MSSLPDFSKTASVQYDFSQQPALKVPGAGWSWRSWFSEEKCAGAGVLDLLLLKCLLPQ